MTKRRMKNAGPKGYNKTLGNQLVNQGKAKRVYIQPNIARTVSILFTFFAFPPSCLLPSLDVLGFPREGARLGYT